MDEIENLTPQERWRKKNVEHLREYQREYMRKRRAAAKSEVVGERPAKPHKQVARTEYRDVAPKPMKESEPPMTQLRLSQMPKAVAAKWVREHMGLDIYSEADQPEINERVAELPKK